MADDDWRGEHLIRNSVKREESTAEVRRLNNKVQQANRKKAGKPNPTAKAHNGVIRSVLAEMKGPKK